MIYDICFRGDFPEGVSPSDFGSFIQANTPEGVTGESISVAQALTPFLVTAYDIDADETTHSTVDAEDADSAKASVATDTVRPISATPVLGGPSE